MLLLGLLLACGADSPRGTPAASTAPRARRGEPIGLCINEVMPGNRAALFDDQGRSTDWIELHNPTDAAVSLEGWSISDDREQGDAHVFGPGLAIEPGGFLLLWARGGDGDDSGGEGSTDPTVLPFQLDGGGEEVALFDPDGDGSVVAYGAVLDDFSLARRTDCCVPVDGEASCWTHSFRGTPGSTNDPGEPVVTQVLAHGSTWSYRDDGGPVGAGWNAPGFDVSGWARGTAPLGYGDSHIVTTVSYGGNSSDKHITTWFAADLALSDVADITVAELGLVRDDGAIVYVNGVEAARSNMPSGAVTAESLASAAVSEAAEYSTWSLPLDPALLVDGTNRIAVEVHQAAPTSSDLTFDLSLTVTRLE